MTRKKGSRPASRGADSDLDDESSKSFSTASQRSFGGRNGSSVWEAELEEIEDDPFHENVEKLYEKRATTREEGLAGLISLLTSQWQYEEAVFRQETFTQMFLGSLKRGGPKESELAARALGLHVITLGASDMSERIFKDALPTLEPIILTGKAVASRVAAIDALSMLCFVGSEGPHEGLPTMALFARAFGKGTAKVQAAALRGWSLLLTTIPSGQLDSDFVEKYIKQLAALLHADDVEVRSAAGEAVALLYDSCGLAELPDTPADAFEPAASAAVVSTPARATYSNGRPPLPPNASPQQQQQPQHDSISAAPAALDAGGLEAAAAALQPREEGAAVGEQAQLQQQSEQVSGEEQGEGNGYHTNGAAPVSLAAQAAAFGDALEQAAVEQWQQQQRHLPESQEGEGQQAAQQGDQAAVEHDRDELAQQEGAEAGEGARAAGGLGVGSRPAQGTEAAATPGTGTRTPAARPGAAQLLLDSEEEEEGEEDAGRAGVPVKRLEDIVSRMRDLAKNRGDASRRSRRERASQRGIFRELCNIVEAGSVPTQKIKLRHGDVLVVDSLPATVRLNGLRRFLAEGFQTHLQDNTLLHQVFNFSPRNERPEKLSAWEKRMFRSPASAESKARTQQRKKDRQTMAAYKGSLLAGGMEG
ncbi:hypothetical protein N2152v2_011161 [Parachlorella kessleri]